ncbi:lysosomal Pro-X carboxypeptidase [Macrosteles quadrilineatus]|uniref:lysosomal Pro-X carboxypeptidase n=1 Tax=Macrosteles quadrilineatus TaxID=74068 RepID=UPI0023E1003B|nr:lysosomal Pro-X carboxypeptidase [Macrosteles quadrilineatus]
MDLSRYNFPLVTSGLGLLMLVTLGASTAPYVYKTMYFETLVDHFNFNSNATFKLRYLINDTYWSRKPNAPIFFYTGNEGDITTFAENTGFMWEIAPDFKALIVFAEHRYYGESMPFGNKSKELQHMGYLSSSQALMDYVELIDHLQDKQGHHNHPVIVFGGSYGGMLSAWMRIKFPATVAGAIASSAPIWQFQGMTPCEAYNRVLTSAYKVESTKCADNIRKSWDAINDVTKTDEGKAWLSSTWKLCHPLKTAENVTKLKSYLNDVYSNLAMVNYPYPSSFLMPLPGHPVKVFCKTIKEDMQGKKLLETMFKGLNVYFNYTGSAHCLDYSSAYVTMDDTMWNYQACSEMIMPMCSDGKNDMFEPTKWNLTELASECYKNYKVQIQTNLVKNLYGGKNIGTVSNIIFSNGLLDPWSSGGVLRNVSETAIAVIMTDSAHHLDLRASNPLDPADVTNARNYYRYTIHKWIEDHRRLHCYA